jgi:hypothetical protein
MSAFVPAIIPEHSGFTPNTERNLSIGRHVEFSHVGEIAAGKDMACHPEGKGDTGSGPSWLSQKNFQDANVERYHNAIIPVQALLMLKLSAAGCEGWCRLVEVTRPSSSSCMRRAS